ncbi:unnamed protein product [Caenorhabditis nigoni]
MYSVASKTNGMGGFEYDEHFYQAIPRFPIFGKLYPVYATTTRASGNEPPAYLEEEKIEKPAVEVSGPSSDSVFEPVERQRHFGILTYTMNDRFKKMMILLVILILLIAGIGIALLVVLLHHGSSEAYFTNFPWYGSVRFDATNMDLEFHSNINDTTTTIQNNLPDRTVGFQDSSIGSNVFDAIEKFYSNTEAPVCGSRILVLLKRYPNEADTSQLVSLIRSHHGIVHVITSATPSGGSQPKTMYFVSSKTNGMGIFQYDEYFNKAMTWFPFDAYPVYATTTKVSGSGTKALPDFHSPQLDDYWTAITYQDHVPIDSFQNLDLRWTNSQDFGSFSVNSRDAPDFSNGGAYIGVWNSFIAVNYNMSLDYNYLGQDMQNLQIRIYSQTPPDSWLPYSD